MGCIEISTGSPILIASILATKGDNAPIGDATLKGIEQAIEEQRKISDHPIELLNYGTDCTAENARSAALELATNPELVAVIGPTCEEEVAVVSPIMDSAGIILLTPSSSEQAYSLTYQLMTAIEQLSARTSDNTLYVPRQALRDDLVPPPSWAVPP